MSRSPNPDMVLFLTCLAITTLIWVLRGFRLLSFIPSSILWILLFVTIGAGIFAGLQRTR